MLDITLKKIVAAKTMIRNMPYTMRKDVRVNNYDKYVKISENLDNDTFEYIEGLKSTIGNFVKHNNIVVAMEKPLNSSKEVKIDFFAKENPLREKFFNLMELSHDRAVKLNKEDIIVKVDPKNKDELVVPSRRIFEAISNAVKEINKTLNRNL